MKKFLLLTISLIAVIALTLSLSVTVFAEDSSENTDTDTAYQTADGENASSDSDSSNTFSEIYDLILVNVDKIFSALAFLSSLILVFAYKKGLIPVINTGLSAIKKSTDNFESVATENLAKAEGSLSFLTDKFVSCVNTVDGISKQVDELTEKLHSIEAEKNSVGTFKTVMLSQIDMLYEIFMNSALPQYSKDALGEKVAEMKKSIACGEENV